MLRKDLKYLNGPIYAQESLGNVFVLKIYHGFYARGPFSHGSTF